MLFNKCRAHLPLKRQSALFAGDDIGLDTSTLVDWVGASTATLMPPVEAIDAHVLEAEQLHIDDTTVPVLGRGKCRKGRLWTYVRDNAPFAGGQEAQDETMRGAGHKKSSPAAPFYYFPDRAVEHPERHLATYSGICQADAYSGYNGFYVPTREPGPIVEASRWAHGRHEFFEIAEFNKAPIAIEAVRRIDELFAIERQLNGQPSDERRAGRQEHARPRIEELDIWFRSTRKGLSSKNRIAKAIDYHLKRWSAFTAFLDDGRICLSNNAAERAIRGIAIGRKNWIFAGSDSGGRRAAAIYTLIKTAKLNNIDARDWLADVLARINYYPARRLDKLLPWHWQVN